MNKAFGGALAALAAVLAVAVPATPAWAHAKLQKTDPANGATVTTPITTISLTFSEPVKQQNTVITVTGPDGVSYSDGAAHRVDNTVTQAIKPLPTGAITVAWKTVAPDGDPQSGTFAFTNAAAPSPSAAASPSAVATSPDVPVSAAPSSPAAINSQSTSSDSGSGSAAWWIAGGVAVVLLIAGGAFWFRRRGAAA